MPAISIIIPVYNVEKYLRRCLDSVLNQTFTDWQAICIDDASTDGSLQILKEYASRDARITVLQNKTNMGLSVTRNRGIDVATGGYIHFLDSDDMLDPCYYADMYAGVGRTDSLPDIVCGGLVSTQPNRTCIIQYRRFIAVYGRGAKMRRTGAAFYGYVVRYLFRREFLNEKKLRFDETMRFMEDVAFTMTAVHLARMVVFVPHALYIYLYNPASLLNNKTESVASRNRVLQNVDGWRRDFARHNGYRHILILRRWRKLWPLSRFMK